MTANLQLVVTKLLVAWGLVSALGGVTTAEAQNVARVLVGEISIVDVLSGALDPAAGQKASDQEDGADEQDAEEPQVQALMAEHRPLYQGKLDASLHTLRDLCHPSREQQEKLLEAGNAALEESLRAYAKQLLRVDGQRGLILANINGTTQHRPWDAVQAALSKAVSEHLPPEQATLYAKELRDREDFHRRATVRNLVSAVDTQLNLNQQQRDAIHAALLDNWQDNWENSARGLMHGAMYLPDLPSKAITPHLNEKQRQVWKQNTRHGSISFGNDGFLGQGVLKVPPFTVQKEPTRDEDTAKAGTPSEGP